MILHPLPSGCAAILQSSHALLAFQLADHWGNRLVPRPGPRADVLAAVLLHDAGWDDREGEPRLAPSGAPLAFDTWPLTEREELWHAAVASAAPRGRYVEYLVSHHVTSLAARSSSAAFADFLATQERRQATLRTELAGDARYAQVFAGGGDEVNRAVMKLADAIAVQLSLGAEAPCTFSGLPTKEGAGDLEMIPAGHRTYRLRPWPLAGRRLSVSADVLLLPSATFASQEELRHAWSAARRQRLTWQLLAPGAPTETTPSD